MSSMKLSQRNDNLLASGYVWVAAATMTVILILGAFVGVPRVGAANDAIELGIDADAARYQALGEFYLASGEAAIQRGIDASVARYQALGEFYLASGEAAIQRGIDASAARYQAQGEAYLAQAGGDMLAASPQLPYTDVSKFYVERLRAEIRDSSASAAIPQLPYTDVSKFYVERLRAEIRQSSALADISATAANPELILARRSYGAGISLAAANPELILARQYYSPGLGLASCSLDGGQLASNPELAIFYRTC